MDLCTRKVSLFKWRLRSWEFYRVGRRVYGLNIGSTGVNKFSKSSVKDLKGL